MVTQEKLISVYIKMLEKKKQLADEFKEQIENIEQSRLKVYAALMDLNEEMSEIPEIIEREDPYLAWNIGVKNDAQAINLYRRIRDAVSTKNKQAKDSEAEMNCHKEKIGNWLLNSMNESGSKSINCGSSGKAYQKTKIRASAADWDKFLSWVAENGAGDAVEKRIKGSFVSRYEEDNGELPPFLNVNKIREVVVTK